MGFEEIYQSTMHVKGVLLKASYPSGQPFLSIFSSFCDHSHSFAVIALCEREKKDGFVLTCASSFVIGFASTACPKSPFWI